MPNYLFALSVAYKGWVTILFTRKIYKNATPDTEINALSLKEKRIVITKDNDFFQSLILLLQVILAIMTLKFY